MSLCPTNRFGVCNGYGTCTFINATVAAAADLATAATATALINGNADNVTSGQWVCVCSYPWGGDGCTQVPPLWPAYRMFSALYWLSLCYGIWRLILITKAPQAINPAARASVAYTIPTNAAAAVATPNNNNTNVVKTIKSSSRACKCRAPWKYITGRGSSGITQWMSLFCCCISTIMEASFTAFLYTETPVNASDVATVEAVGSYFACYSAMLVARRLILPQAEVHPPTRAWLRIFDGLMIFLVVVGLTTFIASPLVPPSWSLFKWCAMVHLLVVLIGLIRSLPLLHQLKATTVTPAQWRVLRTTISFFYVGIIESLGVLGVGASYGFTSLEANAYCYFFQLFLVWLATIQLAWVMSRQRTDGAPPVIIHNGNGTYMAAAAAATATNGNGIGNGGSKATTPVFGSHGGGRWQQLTTATQPQAQQSPTLRPTAATTSTATITGGGTNRRGTATERIELLMKSPSPIITTVPPPAVAASNGNGTSSTTPLLFARVDTPQSSSTTTGGAGVQPQHQHPPPVVPLSPPQHAAIATATTAPLGFGTGMGHRPSFGNVVLPIPLASLSPTIVTNASPPPKRALSPPY